ncbi:MAG: MATE family efflux transporter [Spirochaetia bacterium]|nr:MATE family efflux transporter [Spirochaetia bacterium]
MKSLHPRFVTKELLILSMPIMVSNFLQVLYNTADAFFLGKLGKEAISAPSITMNISNFIIVFGAAFSVAGTTMIAQAYGNNRENKERLTLLTSQVFLVNIFMSIIVTIVGYSLSHPLLNLMKVPEGLTYAYTYSYMSITFLTMPFFFLDLSLRSVFQGFGDSVTPLYVQLVAVIINIILDPILIFGLGPIPPLQVFGAAIATFIARLISGLISLLLLIKGKDGVRISFASCKPHFPTLKTISRIGFPSSIGQSISSLGFAVIQGSINSFGPVVIAAMGVGNRIQSFFQMPAQGVSQGVSILAGNKLGKNEPKEAQKVVTTGLLLIGVLITIGMSFVVIFGKWIIIFFVNDPLVIKEGTIMFYITAPSVVVFSIFTVLLGAFQAGGKTKDMMAMNVARLWGLRVPLVFLIPTIFAVGSHGIYIAMLISNIVATMWAVFTYRTGKWKVNLIESDS